MRAYKIDNKISQKCKYKEIVIVNVIFSEQLIYNIFVNFAILNFNYVSNNFNQNIVFITHDLIKLYVIEKNVYKKRLEYIVSYFIYYVIWMKKIMNLKIFTTNVFENP